MLDPLQLTGRTRSHIVQLDALRAALHAETVAPFLAMREAAAAEGIDLRVSSAFRDFDAQLAIWNRKYRGERPLLAPDGSVRDHASLGEAELIDAILQWSALPGTSRHHWGTDVDVYDAAAMPEGYRLQLLPAEYAPDGLFARLSAWLDANLARFRFFRPYDANRGGVQPEPWHLSYAPVSTVALSLLTPALIEQTLRDTGLFLGRDAVLARLDQIYERYVRNVGAPPDRSV